ncbi:hypothetical protein EHO57_13815 [Leptospira langatensis]|uniref:Uncharacterized protein n=1 Tax=Leptospira langatensis TaxID=2484983 RepID=A0A5R2AT38_9LEPT|nr:hypothetical protein [Leptospira langatensis]TGJ99834.1 hypothetical protein EHO57_13815 [Leptospira langatensis]
MKSMNKYLKIITYYWDVFTFTTGKFFILPIFLFSMLKMAWVLWKQKLKLRTAPIGQVILIHYNPETIQSPELLAPIIEESIFKPFRLLHNVDPIVLILPLGMTLQSGTIQGLLRSLNADQRAEIQRQLYQFRNKIEVVPG